MNKKFLFAAVTGFFIFFIFTLCLSVGWVPEWLYQGDDSIRKSIYASSVEDLVFFALVTGVLVIANMPHLQNLDSRLSTVFTSDQMSNDLKNSIKKDVIESAIYSPNTKVIISIEGYNERLNALKVSVEAVIELSSAIPDSHYDNLREIKLVFDDFDDMGDEPYGELLKVQSSSTKRPTPETQIDRKRLFMEKKASFKVREKNEKYENSFLQIQYWSWVKSGADFNYKTHRITENFTLEVRNDIYGTNTNILVRIKHGSTNEVLSDTINLASDRLMLTGDVLEFNLFCENHNSDSPVIT